ncbi:HAD family hydrolase [Oceanirhabdus sp. W0125-5]|uniref:HAD family hydrolase n=1 Tax=Oceanirhabdus sp. W0125-5 TaxID=2999116 RepID=UPI0022F325F5|nr:HAD family phosphatase [Oceanirhabdus sp. W0125-5]WBW95994.1 HAD family phosphatase [Oceanirhabdus sp. W0125-5]
MIKAVVFDMDGLMFDTERLTIKAWDYAGEKIGIGKMGHMVYKTLGMNIESARKVFIEEYGERVTEEDLSKHAKEFFHDYYNYHGIPMKPGLIELLTYLKENNYKIAVATSSNKEVALRHFKRANITDYFDVIVCGDMIENSKPAPDIYLKASELLGVSPSECLALEDSPNGINSAFSAQLIPVMIPDLIEPTEELSGIVHSKLTNLHEVIELLNSIHMNSAG